MGRRRLDADEDQAWSVEQLGHLGGEGERVAVALDQLRKLRLGDRDLAATERLDLLGDDLADHDTVADLREAGGGHQPDPAGSDYPNRLPLAHERLSAPLRSP